MKNPNPYQLQCFFAAMGRSPNTQSEFDFAYALSASPEDAAWLHTTSSAEYANRVVSALEAGDNETANHHLLFFRKEGEQSRGMGKEALSILQAYDLLEELYNGELIVPDQIRLQEIQAVLEGIQTTPRLEHE